VAAVGTILAALCSALWLRWTTASTACSAGSYPCSAWLPGHGRVELAGPEEALILLGLPPFREADLQNATGADFNAGASRSTRPLNSAHWWATQFLTLEACGLCIFSICCGLLGELLSSCLARARRHWRMSKVMFNAKPQALNSVGDRPTCHICLGLFVSPVTSPCGHSFCRVCYKQMLLGIEVPKCFCGEELPLVVPPINVALRDIVANAYPDQTNELELRARQEEVELDERLSCCGGYKPGDRVLALVSRSCSSMVDGLHTTLRFERGDEGIILGLASGRTSKRAELRCRFPGYSSAIVKLSDICKPLPGDFKPGDQVISTIDYNWPGGLSLAISDIGEVTGPATEAALDKEQQVRCKFPNNPDVNVFWTQIKLRGVAGGFNVGDQIVSLVTSGNLARGDEGEVIGPFLGSPPAGPLPAAPTRLPPLLLPARGDVAPQELLGRLPAGTVQDLDPDRELGCSGTERIRCRFVRLGGSHEEDVNVSDICPRLPGRFKPGDVVVSLIHEIWPGGLKLEIGHAGEVIGPAGEAAVDRCRQVRCMFPENPDVNIFIDQIRPR